MNLVIKHLFAWLLLGGFFAEAAPRREKPSNDVLILYDSAGPYGWIGGLHARMLANLLGHFELTGRILPIEGYEPGSMALAHATFYIGTVFDNPLPPAFLEEALTTERPIAWFRYNLWQLGNGSPSGTEFQTRFGFRFEFMDQAGYEQIHYKGETLSKEQLDPELGRVTILNPGLATVPATACQDGSTNCVPYVVQSGHFWYIADTPFSYISEEDRYLAFADLLHDILRVFHNENHRALIRLEDIDPTYPPELLRRATDCLRAEGIPFLVSTIPVYADPLGFYNGGVAEIASLSRSPRFARLLKQLPSLGGQIVLHGCTHQYGAVANPYTGATGDDYEFFRVTVDAEGGIDEFRPVPEDSRRWVQDRVQLALRELKRAGLAAAAWETPHYAASPLDYEWFGRKFPLTIQRVLYFDGEGNVIGGRRKPGLKGPFDSSGHIAGQFFPYVIQRDLYGQKIAPENLGNVDPVGGDGSPARLPADLLRAARKNLVVRDGWASAFFHPYLDIAHLRELVQGVKALGYTYVPLSADLE